VTQHVNTNCLNLRINSARTKSQDQILTQMATCRSLCRPIRFVQPHSEFLTNTVGSNLSLICYFKSPYLLFFRRFLLTHHHLSRPTFTIWISIWLLLRGPDENSPFLMVPPWCASFLYVAVFLLYIFLHVVNPSSSLSFSTFCPFNSCM